MKSTRFGIYIIIFASTLLINIERAFSGVVTTVPVSAEVGTGIAANLFPVGLKFDALNLFLTFLRLFLNRLKPWLRLHIFLMLLALPLSLPILLCT